MSPRSAVHVPGCKHVRNYADCLYSNRVDVDLRLCEAVLVAIEPEKEAVLKGKCFDGSTDWRPKEK